MKEKNIFKEAVVLLFVALMVFSSGAVVANTTNHKVNIDVKEANSSGSPLNRGLVWDNVVGVHADLGGIIVATVRINGTAFPADDFKLSTQKEVDSVFWQGGYFQCQLAQGQKDYHYDWRILFWDDDGAGTHPGNIIYNQTISDASITREFWYNYTNPNGNTYWVANYSVQLPVNITFNADTTYWITIQGIQGPTVYYPQACWSRHNNTVGGIKLHEAVIQAAWWGYPAWTNISVLVADHLPHDLNYQLFGPGGDTTPPVTTCTFNGTLEGDVYVSDVIVTITATDDSSGVNYTKYNLDSGGWTTYTAPFTVTTDGLHVLQCYSVDFAGNVEEAHYCNFTIQHPAPPITITIKGGIGVSATIKNTGTTDLTNIDWTITLDGSLIFIGKTKGDTIASLAAGESVIVKDFVIGFGKTGIAVEAGTATANATGTVILFFVIGIGVA
ncbi:MAG: hypothetical protein IMZ58_11375 [Thermoplasmata archaeon]|nr:hypothetical protein [Thermoplasmata archaeon]